MTRLTRHTARVWRNQGVEITVDPSYSESERRSLDAVEDLWPRYPKTKLMWDLLTSDVETRTNLDMADYLTVSKLAYNDHGETHARLVAANGLLMYDFLRQSGKVEFDVVDSRAGDHDDAALVTVSALLLHDIGNQAHRHGHEQFSAILALPILNRLMPEIYPDTQQRVQLRAFILHAINSHDLNPPPLTVEATLVSIADGTDITKGRGRTAFDLGKVDIHSVSALAIDEVLIGPGEEYPVEITVVMNNSAGIFQIDETLTRKVVKSPLANYITVTAVTQPEDDTLDMRIIQRLCLTDGVFTAE